MLIPLKYKDDPSTTPADGSVEVTCNICNSKFWVPPDLIPQIGVMPVCENPGCAEAYDKMQQAMSATQMKTEASVKDADLIKAAMPK